MSRVLIALSFSVLLVIFTLTRLQAGSATIDQWEAEKLDVITWLAPNRDGEKEQFATEYLPGSRLQLSSIAINETQGRSELYLPLEKEASILRLQLVGSAIPEVVRYEVPEGIEQIDIEAAYFFEDSLYLVHEDVPLLLKVDPDGGQAKVIKLDHDFGVVTKGKNTDKWSIEGLAISPTSLMNPEAESNGPWFYLLDERNECEGSYYSVLYEARLEDGKLARVDEKIMRLKGANHRYTDLFLFKAKLYAIHSEYDENAENGKYSIDSIDPRSGYRTTVLELTRVLSRAKLSKDPSGYSNNLEGLAISGAGHMYLATDNAKSDKGPSRNSWPKYSTLVLRIPSAPHKE